MSLKRKDHLLQYLWLRNTIILIHFRHLKVKKPLTQLVRQLKNGQRRKLQNCRSIKMPRILENNWKESSCFLKKVITNSSIHGIHKLKSNQYFKSKCISLKVQQIPLTNWFQCFSEHKLKTLTVTKTSPWLKDWVAEEAL